MERIFDGHRIAVEGDTVTVEFGSEFQPASVRDILAFLEEQVPRPTRFYLITYATRLTVLGAESRRLLGKWDGFRRVAANAIVGASPMIRVIGLLTLRAIQIYQRYDFPYAFFDREAQARAWLDSLRPPSAPSPS
jgi:hypothetical protein